MTLEIYHLSVSKYWHERHSLQCTSNGVERREGLSALAGSSRARADLHEHDRYIPLTFTSGMDDCQHL